MFNIPWYITFILGAVRLRRAGRLVQQLQVWRELGGSQGMGFVGHNQFDRVLLSMLHVFKPSWRPLFKPPSLGPRDKQHKYHNTKQTIVS